MTNYSNGAQVLNWNLSNSIRETKFELSQRKESKRKTDYADARAIAREKASAIISHIITPCKKISVRANLVVPLKLSRVVVKSEVKEAIK